jgi:hypothetical protein
MTTRARNLQARIYADQIWCSILLRLHAPLVTAGLRIPEPNSNTEVNIASRNVERAHGHVIYICRSDYDNEGAALAAEETLRFELPLFREVLGRATEEDLQRGSAELTSHLASGMNEIASDYQTWRQAWLDS